MPNTQPVIDSLSTIEFILQKSRSAPVQVLPIASVTMGENGSELTPMAELQRGGAVAFSDDGRPVSNSQLMREAMEAAKRIGVPIIDHCEDPFLFQGGSMNEGPACAHLGHRGIPSACEEIMVARNLLLSKLTGARIHMAHMSTVGSMKLIRDAKNEGLAVTAEVTPHHFTLTDEAVAEYGSNAKMNPPLRTSYDVHGVLEAIADGTVDVIASDHAPHTEVTKKVEFGKAAFGILGLETSLSLGYDRLVSSGIIPLRRFIELYSLNPAKILGLKRGIYKGAEASLTVFHPAKQMTVKSSTFLSKSRNTPFEGWLLRGSPWATIYRGTVVWKHKDLK
jgi:dihydroorotase